MSDSKPLRITLPPLQITLKDEQQVSLQWLAQNLESLTSQNQPKLPDHWKKWVAINKLLNQPDESLIQRMVESGIDVKIALEEVTTVTSDPHYQAAEQFVQLWQKLESLFKIQNELASLSSQATTIERKPTLSRQEFLDHYYAKNTPVILTDVMNNWKALEKWSPEYFKTYYGDVTVEVQANRDSDPNYELNVHLHRKSVFFKEYIDWISSTKSSNDYYMVANNGNLDRDEMKGLLDDIEIFPEYLDANERKGRIFFWFGPAGTITPLHHDPVNIFLAQVSGRKRIKMFSPQQTPFLYNHLGVFSQVDLENPDYAKYPLFSQVKPIEIILYPGEVIFIPVGWWHHVKGLDLSISLSFINFLFPNYYEWKNPTFGRQ